jgi:septal ring factor EnvC (AmiA/AmiB activator)
VVACNEEIASLREKSGHLKRKVRRAAEEEKSERERIASLELEVAALEDQLAHKIHELG